MHPIVATLMLPAMAYSRVQGVHAQFVCDCRNYYAEVWVRHADWKEAEFFDELPAHLRGEVAAYLMAEVFDQSDFFRYTSKALQSNDYDLCVCSTSPLCLQHNCVLCV